MIDGGSRLLLFGSWGLLRRWREHPYLSGLHGGLATSHFPEPGSTSGSSAAGLLLGAQE